METYESLLALVQALPWSQAQNIRTVRWLASDRALGIARDSNGDIELFIGSTVLQPSVRRVRDNMEVHSWRDAAGARFDASRLMLPGGASFEGLAAFLCSSLLSAGVEPDPAGAFRQIEPVLALALESQGPSETQIIGLVGELLVLVGLVNAASDVHVREVIRSWLGSGRSSRDFELRSLGIEVKTTRGPNSVHFLHGLAQCEIGHPTGSQIESDYFLVSLGLSESLGGPGSFCLPELVSIVADRLEVALGRASEAPIREFLDAVRDYGGFSSRGYDHALMAESTQWNRRWGLRFARSYDMTDASVGVFGSSDFVNSPSVLPQDTTVAVRLPSPRSGESSEHALQRVTKELLTQALSAVGDVDDPGMPH